MLVVLALVVFAVVVGLVSRLAPRRVKVKSCCSTRPWPPDDLTG